MKLPIKSPNKNRAHMDFQGPAPNLGRPLRHMCRLRAPAELGVLRDRLACEALAFGDGRNKMGTPLPYLQAPAIWRWVKTNGIPFWGRCTTHFRTDFSWDWDVHWGYRLLTAFFFPKEKLWLPCPGPLERCGAGLGCQKGSGGCWGWLGMPPELMFFFWGCCCVLLALEGGGSCIGERRGSNFLLRARGIGHKRVEQSLRGTFASHTFLFKNN